ncbi:Cell wall alpha-1,3-glucan synthase ags1 [Puccinia graminis f. sp. tritici]|uniref:alpha-1,3-glucan synthase n=1 Tax=Puccinia graminis f. sp. tritici TaxID=56615 RepID=A0A5B0MK11_PUCGR|nr:Cell wall alpha-1,3-glucan synthase ags1 [Puccinia graminis f. sp. tritici]
MATMMIPSRKRLIYLTVILLGILPLTLIQSHPYDSAFSDYNINVNSSAGNNVLDYYSDWPEKTQNGSRYTPSPVNWRELPIYTVILDRFMDGNPSNNDFYKSRSEWDFLSNQLRHGGDIEGFAQDRVLDYIYGMGYRTIYIAGTPWLNMPWQSDGYSALDFTLLDPHFGTLSEWRTAIDKIHSKGMYVMLDTTTTTLSDFLEFKGNSGKAAPFNLHGYEVEYKTTAQKPWNIKQYAEFQFTNTRDQSCRLPKFYNPNGSEVLPPTDWDGCYAGDFDQFGDSSPAGKAPAWQDQLTKYSGVQDRLREWDSGVATKLEKLACMTVKALDMDALRVDKATQQSLEFMGKWGGSLRTCAKDLGKTNFFITGEISDGNTFGSLYIGRGRQPSHYANLEFDTAALVNPNQTENFMRPAGENALDSAAFHYSIYRSLTRFLGMDGELDSPFDIPVNWAEAWRQLFVTNDFLNQETQLVDPRHLYGTTNQDNFRWASLINGTERFLLGQLVTNLIMPGIPFAFYGEEQDMHIFDSQANDYLYGRQPMSSSRAWQVHGCYKLGSKKYPTMPLGKALNGCKDDWNSLDHYDPTSGTRNALAHFAYLRSQYSSLQDGFNLTQLGNWTTFGELPASSHTPTEWGLWSVSRSALKSQKLSGPNPDLPVWILYSNVNQTTTFSNDCSSRLAIVSPYTAPSTVRNLFYPYETYDLDPSSTSSTGDDAPSFLGCLKSITMDPFSFKVLVPTPNWINPQPRLVGFTPGHDARIISQPDNDNETIPISFLFSDELLCEGVSTSLSLNYTIDPKSKASPRIDLEHANCSKIDSKPNSSQSALPAVWQWSSSIVGAPDGVYELILNNATGQNGIHTNSIDHLIFRKGRKQNPITFSDVWYSESLLENRDGKYALRSDAAGADLMRYSIDFGNTYSNWTQYSSDLILPDNAFSISKFWEGDHVRVQYWSRLAGSAAPTIDADINFDGGYQRRFPQLILRGSFNKWGYDEGIPGLFSPRNENMTIDVITSWPHEFQLAVFEARDKVFYGDVDNDGVLDLLPPNSQARNFLSLPPPSEPFMGWRIMINPKDLTWGAQPVGHQKIVIMLLILLLLIPPTTALLACWLYQKIFYKVKHNQHFPKSIRNSQLSSSLKHLIAPNLGSKKGKSQANFADTWPDNMNARRKVLIATLEYEIIDWKIKVKIGGLGVMSSLMGKVMDDLDLLWVIPKVSDLEYPEAERTQPIPVVVFGQTYLVECQIHKFQNITYYLLDSPVFRANTKENPYPARMDDLSSAIFYSYWNQSIAEICRRTPDLTIYHINDYHGALAPLYLLPTILPVSLSLHNAEFQGQWPLGTPEEEEEVCRSFNLSSKVCSSYARYGSVFNLLHAAASYISQHQNSIGVAGVSEKYGKRSWARYPVLWTLKSIEPLPNPDPSDVESLDVTPLDMRTIQIDQEAESKRPGDKLKLQDWAGLHQDPEAQVFVFVGRWSFQKGVDLIADVFPLLLEKRKDVQLIAIGPVIDLYGKLAALKLNRLMEIYPGRVFSKPVFTSLPDFVFSGGDFALIPSRDEPFGLVAVEFGRKGALGVGSRLGGLGLMPGWWFPVESDSTAHLHSQFAKTLKAALESPEEERALLRARSAHQRFPVLEWRIKMEDIHSRSVRASRKYAGRLASNIDPIGAIKPDESPSPSNDQGVTCGAHPSSSASHKTGGMHSSSTENQPDALGSHLNQTRPSLDVSRMLSSSNKLAVQLSEAVKRLMITKNGNQSSRPSEIHSAHVDDSSTPSERPPNDDQEILNSIVTLEKINNNADEHNLADFQRTFSRQDDKNSPLNQAVKDFTDEDGKASQDFVRRLQKLDVSNSQTELCIATYIVAAHKAHFNEVRKGTLALAKTKFASSPTLSVTSIMPRTMLGGGINPHINNLSDQAKNEKNDTLDVTTALSMNLWQIRLQRRVFGWPIYTILLAVGQILGATSFQLSLLSGTSSNGSFDFYVIGAVNILGSASWYGLSCRKPATWSLSMPWIFFGLAFVFIGLPSLSENLKQYSRRHPLAVAASGFYSFASSAGFCKIPFSISIIRGK